MIIGGRLARNQGDLGAIFSPMGCLSATLNAVSLLNKSPSGQPRGITVHRMEPCP